MFFDDRLATVLRQAGDSEANARTQFRQLLDILGNRKFGPKANQDNSLIAAAWLRMDALAAEIPSDQRAAIIRERGWRLRSADLTAHLADFEPEVASAALNRAELSAEDWSALIPRLPVRARGFLRLRRDLPVNAEALLERLGVYDRGLPQPGAEASTKPPTASKTKPGDEHKTGLDKDEPSPSTQGQPAPIADGQGGDSAESDKTEIAALVERIAQFRRERDTPVLADEISPELPLDEIKPLASGLPKAFGFTANPSGQVDWAEGEAGPMLVGTRLANKSGLTGLSLASTLERAFLRRQPLARLPFEVRGADAVAGTWIIDAQPQFTQEGHFTGYVGRFLRQPETTPGSTTRDNEADRIRQLLHELRTPITAVQGYAEVIQQQLFGPAPHEYRALAASIAADAARILAGFEELDRLARLETGAIEMSVGSCDFGAVVAATIDQLQPVLEPRLAGFELAIPKGRSIEVPLHQDDAEGLVWRVFSTLAAGCAAGETLECTVARTEREVIVTSALPAQLLAEDDVFSADAKLPGSSVNTGLFGAGFALRLARAETIAAGGSLKAMGEIVELRLPLLTEANRLPSD